MIKQEIRSFELHKEGVSLGSHELPISLARELVRQPVGTFGGVVTLRADFTAGGLIYSMRRVILNLGRTAHCHVRVNGKDIGRVMNAALATFDIKDYLHIGKNTLELEMNEREMRDNPRMATVGSAELIGFNHDIITSVFVSSEFREESVELTVRAQTLEGGGATRAVATLVSPGGRVYYCGMTSGSGVINITEPNPWRPSLLGVQNLYRLTVNLYADGEIIDSRDLRVGLIDLSVRWADDKDRQEITVAGESIYMKAVLLGTDDLYLPLLDTERIRKNLTECASFGFNSVIIRDTGVYPVDELFSVADELGLFVIPELSSVENLHAFTQAYRERLSHVSFSMLLLTGDARSVTLPDEFAHVGILRYDSTDSQTESTGAALPTLATLREMLSPDDMNINSPALARLSELDNNAELTLGLRDRFPSGLSDAYYAISLGIADKLAERVGEARRDRRSAPLTVLPRLTDPRPTVSPSLIDHSGRRKAHGYALSRLFAPAFVGAVADGTRVTFFVSNEAREEKSFKFSYSVLSADARPSFRDSFTVTVPPLSSMDILTSDFAEIVGERTDEFYVAYSISDSFITVSRGTLLFTPPKYFKFLRPNIFTELTGGGTHFILTVSSDAFARGIEISFGDTAVHIEDNYFDITDRSPIRVDLVTEHATAIEVLRRELRIRSAYDIGRLSCE